MQCSRCGGMNRKEDVKCFACGEALRMVPDYNPIEDDILQQVQSALSESGQKFQQQPRNNAGRGSGSHTGRLQERRNHNGHTGRMNGQTGRLQGQTGRLNQHNGGQNGNDQRLKHTTDLSPEELELKRRRQYARKKEQERRQRQMLLSFAIAVGLLLGIIGYVLYSNSYAGIVGKANSLSNSGEFTAAVTNYNKAITKNNSKIDAYEGLASLYVLMEDLPQAQISLQQAVDTNPDKVDMYLLMIDFYFLTNQSFEIMPFIKTCKSESVLQKLEDYYVEDPIFSLEAKTYEDVQELSITAIDGDVYYTADGTDPTINCIPYSGPLQISEGTTVVQAFVYNEKGIPSVVLRYEYMVELPIEGAPIVSPSTGQYDEVTQIVVQVPSGYTAYYTMDGSVPNVNSTMYTGPLEMPEGNTVFSAVLVHTNGRTSDATKRNYIYE